MTTVLDPFILALAAVIGFAVFLPATGAAVPVVDHATTIGIALLFFMYGGRLPTDEFVDGLRHARLHLTVLACTFVLFPLLGLLIHLATPMFLPPLMVAGLLFLTLLPSTVQSSVSFTSIAHGNVSASICAATISNLLGVVITPLWVLVAMGGTVTPSWASVQSLVIQLIVPFILGQLLQRWVGPVLRRYKTYLTKVDRGVILLVVYGAFSDDMRAHMWTQVGLGPILLTLIVCAVLLTIVMFALAGATRLLRFNRADRLAIFFAGSKKSLTTGLPMAAVLFGPKQVGILVIPVMMFHQLQLIVCAQLARRWSRDPVPEAPDDRVAVTAGQ
ncbi:bile acid:sodium symporter family protein [Flexivirga meconopsidis]|uniref:bile acid:sodium symporter family protein n=1 Tax=Flexivirga meconopsidis TaxID=2977121 RepID=UPI00223F6A73